MPSKSSKSSKSSKTSKTSKASQLQLYYLQRPPPIVPDLPSLQTYFPSLEILFPSLTEHTKGSPTLAASELVVDISGSVATVEHLITKERRPTPFWVRMMHLVEPVDVMSGDYVLPLDGALPAFRAGWQRALRKINDPYNEAYTDAVFACMASRLVETGLSPHFARFYGTFSGRAPSYSYNITDDMADIEGEPWFHEGQKKGEFDIMVVDPCYPEISAPFSFYASKRPVRPVRPVPSDDDDCNEVGDDGGGDNVDSESESQQSDGSTHSDSSQELEVVEADLEVEGEAVVNRNPSRLHLSHVSRPHSLSNSGSTGSSDDDYLEFRAIFKNFPVQFTVLERCDGTMDDLMEDEIDSEDADMHETKEARWTAWMFQVIAALTTAQAAYDFVHNDLHTNNVMWCGTGETHLFYKIHGPTGGDRVYRVPTYGRIFKIIDFGRATFRPPTSSKKSATWIPDSYAPGADAEGQYNCGLFFKQGLPKVSPNRSFDLSRLAVAMLDTLWPEQPEEKKAKKVLTKEPGLTQHETVSPLWNLLWLWLTDDKGRNVLRLPSGEERYPEFDLYCAIARDIHNAVPVAQLTLPLFDSAFKVRAKDVPAEATVWDLQAAR